MKTFIILPSYPLGGAERQAFEYAKFEKNNSDISIVDLESSQQHRVLDGVNILGYNCDVLHLTTKNKYLRKVKRYITLYKIYKILKTENVDNLVFYNPIFLKLAFFLSFSDKKVFFSIREYSARLLSSINIFCMKKIKNIYTNTIRVKNTLDNKGVKCELILNTINFHHPKSTIIRKNNNILVISNIEPHKKIETLLIATRDMQLTIDICGKISNLPYYKYCQSIAERSNCQITFGGSISSEELNKKLCSCTLLAHLSVMEGTSNAILDALTNKTPVLVSDIPENTYLVDDLANFIFCKENPSSLRIKLENTLMSTNTAAYKKELNYLSERVKIKFAKENFKIISRLLNLV